MSRWIERYCRLLDAISALCLAVMVVLVFGNVVLRYAFDSGISLSEEVSRWLFVWMTFLGAIVALKEHGHLGTDWPVHVAREVERGLTPGGRRVELGPTVTPRSSPEIERAAAPHEEDGILRRCAVGCQQPDRRLVLQERARSTSDPQVAALVDDDRARLQHQARDVLPDQSTLDLDVSERWR